MNSLMHKLWKISKRLMLGVGGQIGVSGANFLLSFTLLSKISPEDFGTFAFIQVLIFFGFGLSSALLSSPMMANLHRDNKPREETLLSFFHASMIIGLLIAISIYALSALTLSQTNIASVLFAISAFLLFTSRLARTYLLDHEKAPQVLVSDYVYSLVLISGCATGFLYNMITVNYAVGLLAVSSLLSCLSMGKEALVLQWNGLRLGAWEAFVDGFKTHGRHALAGVITTEMTGRSHSYIVTFWLGAAAFAPLAAAVLFFRPVLLVILSLTQFERAKLARLLRNNENKKAWTELKFFYGALMATWLANIILIWVVLEFFFDKFLSKKYSYDDIFYALTLYAFITALACLRGPASALLQANAEFKALSKTTIISSALTIPTVIIFVYFYGAVWSLAGVLLGEIVAAFLIFRLARRKIPKV